MFSPCTLVLRISEANERILTRALQSRAGPLDPVQAYSLRDAMNSLAKDKPEAQGVAKVFYRDIEDVIFSTRTKDQAAAMKAYNSAQEHLTKYLSLI